MDDFLIKVYLGVQNIPRGKVVTYKQVATYAGRPRLFRMVGFLMKHNPDFIKIPCHRVVGSDGNLVGYSGKGGIDTKRGILLNEGVYFLGNRVDLSKSLWSL